MSDEAKREARIIEQPDRSRRREFLRRGGALTGAALMSLVPDAVRQGAWAAGSDAPEKTGVKMMAGLFPETEVPKCDLFMAFDVIEHSPFPDAFMQSAAALLTLEGIAIIQTPIDHHHSQPPFPGVFANVFDDLEHLFV